MELISFRKFVESDKNEIVSMMETFYSSDAVYTNGSSEIFCCDFDTCVSNSPFLDGYVFLIENIIVGEAKTATTIMASQLEKYLKTGLFRKGYEMHPDKPYPTKNCFGLFNINNNFGLII